MNKMVYVEGIKLCILNNYFKYNENHYKMIICLAMGGILSMALISCNLNKISNEQLAKMIEKSIFIKTYIYDIIFTKEKQDEELLNLLNNINKNIIFMVEKPINNKIRYLDK